MPSTVVLIDGHPASGKSLIRGMLDGHSLGFVSPFHDLLPLAFCRKAYDENALTARDIEWLRQALICHARYSRIERIARHREFYLEPIAGEMKRIYLGLDFPAFDAQWVEDLSRASETWHPEMIIATIYANLKRFIQPDLQSQERGYEEFYATLGDGDITSSERFLNRFPNGKIIYMRREPVEIFAALCARKPQPGNYRTANNNQSLLFEKYMREGLLRRIQTKNVVIDRLAKDHPDRVLIVDFQAFFSHFEEFVDRISSFIGIDYESSLNRFSFNNESVYLSNGESIFSAPKDTPEGLLTKKQMAVLDPWSARRLPLKFYGIAVRYFLLARSKLSKVKSICVRIWRLKQ